MRAQKAGARARAHTRARTCESVCARATRGSRPSIINNNNNHNNNIDDDDDDDDDNDDNDDDDDDDDDDYTFITRIERYDARAGGHCVTRPYAI